jgi:DNA polymerase/3'-5' exonuclease PolX
MSSAARIPLGRARHLACEVVALLRDRCERIEVAGSIRRARPDVGDVEIVCVPRISETVAGLFGDRLERRNELDALCQDLIERGVFAHRLASNGQHAFGERLKRLTYGGVALDLFSVLPPAEWGVILAIRTGPAEFSRRLVTRRRSGGLLPDWLRVQDGAIWHGADPVPTPEEADVFRLLGLPNIPPAERTGTERAAVPAWVPA